jgi:hypothetical protein
LLIKSPKLILKIYLPIRKMAKQVRYAIFMMDYNDDPETMMVLNKIPDVKCIKKTTILYPQENIVQICFEFKQRRITAILKELPLFTKWDFDIKKKQFDRIISHARKFEDGINIKILE